MAKIVCPKCKEEFENNTAESLVTRGAAGAAGAGTGAYIGTEVGIVGGPFGAINGMWMGAAIGGLAGWFAADQFRRCPKCNRIFKT